MSALGRSPTSSFLLGSLFSDALDLPQGSYLDLSHPRKWETTVFCYHALFAAYDLRPKAILFRLSNWRFYTGPHVQAYLMGLDAEQENAERGGPSGSKMRWRHEAHCLFFRQVVAATP